jgi:hypothetical protein
VHSVISKYISNKIVVEISNLAITGERTHDCLSGSCAVAQYSPTRYRAWWMLTFPVDTVYITNVKIYFQSDGKFKVHSIFPCDIYLTMQKNLKRLRQVDHIRGQLIMVNYNKIEHR